jgi:hypothetical protein
MEMTGKKMGIHFSLDNFVFAPAGVFSLVVSPCPHQADYKEDAIMIAYGQREAHDK